MPRTRIGASPFDKRGIGPGDGPSTEPSVSFAFPSAAGSRLPDLPRQLPSAWIADNGVEVRVVGAAEDQAQAGTEALNGARRHLREQLRTRVDARGLATAPRTERRVRVREEALRLLRDSGAILPQGDLTRVVNEISDEVVGFGHTEFLLKDPEVTEVTRTRA